MLNLTSENKNYQDLVNRSEGAFLRKDYLEAFLLQSCVIEGVVKNYAEATLHSELAKSRILKEKFKNFEMARLIDDLFLAKKLTPELHEDLNKYRKKRNEVVHHLLELENEVTLDEELKEAYEAGRQMKGWIVENLTKETTPGITLAELEAQIADLMVQIEEIGPGTIDRMFGKINSVRSKQP